MFVKDNLQNLWSGFILSFSLMDGYAISPTDRVPVSVQAMFYGPKSAKPEAEPHCTGYQPPSIS